MNSKRAQERAIRPRGAAPGRQRSAQKPIARSLGELPSGESAALIGAAADIALVLGPEGRVEQVISHIDGLPPAGPASWLGRAWAELVTPESRNKVEQLMDAAARKATGRTSRHVNHPAISGDDFPVMYAAVPMGGEGKVLAIGRDMRALAELQKRLVDAQHVLERDYWRLRNVEARYRLLFDQAAEAIVIVDAGNGQVVEANAAAKDVLGVPLKRLVGQVFPVGWPAAAQRALAAMLGRVRASGRSEDLRVRLAPKTERWVNASVFTQEERPMFLLRLGQPPSDEAASPAGRPLMVAQAVERVPDGFVVTDGDGRIRLANPAFVGLTQLAAEDQVLGESIERWLGRPGVDWSVMLATLRQQGALRLFNTVLHGEHGADSEVEISGAAVPEADPPCMAFQVRHVGRRLGQEPRGVRTAPRSVEQLTQLVGRMPLKDLVRESTDLIERLCIEAALQLTQGNRASAAEMLGLSRQSLYVKLRRYGIADAGGD